ncbi:ABC transporter permease [Emcibacter sp.]|uniref:ABC transporter permease n=1 Tax=Emcibacter sp. TaxID=1979954 RepID=UPI002AA75CED|nr:ABC transporter permease [Emcibacter sp.]
MEQTPGIVLQAIKLIFSTDSAVWEIVALSLYVSLTALLLAALIGLPLGAVLALKRFPGNTLLNVVLNTFMGLPPVVVGLLVYMMLSRSGPLGLLGLLYTPGAMIVAQTLLILPIIAALSRQVLSDYNREYDELFRSWGLGFGQSCLTLIRESRLSLMTVMLAGFGRAIAEVGAVMIVGGNIEHYTRTMTTTIQMEVTKGNLELAMALGIVLLLIALGANFLLHWIRILNRVHMGGDR